jgi:hypothetical protein
MSRKISLLLALLCTLALSTGCNSTVADAPLPQTSQVEAAVPELPLPSETLVAEPVKKAADAKTKAVTEIPQPLSQEELTEGWISLFDGTTLFGWKANSDADWQVQDGAIVVASGKPGLLNTSVQFADYRLKVDFRAAKGTNSGVFLRCPEVVGKDDITHTCYELNIAPPDNPFPTGSLVGRKKVEGAGESDEWRTFDVTVYGPQVIVSIDGKEVLKYDDPNPAGRGHIGLQLNSGKVAFRNIKLRPLGLNRIFNGKDLTGWKDVEGSKSKFVVNVAGDGELNVTNGRGALESAGSYGDFVLQFECISHAKNLNSGIFFRSIPGEVNNGYETQVHNGFKNGDRAQPADFGTGGIYRRVPARIVAANDLEWFYDTLIADGPHIACWVNGYQVTDWTDTRAPDKNPRNGLRLEPGTLQIQGHDPTTNLSFRNLRIVETPPR